VEDYGFSIRYFGNGLTNNSIPVRELAPSLLALSEALSDIQKLKNPLEKPISLDIKATEKGSFIVDMVLTTDVFNRTVDFLTGNGSTAILNLSSYVAIFMEIMRFIREKKDKRLKKQETIGENKTRVTFEDGTSVEISNDSLNAYKNIEIRKSTKEVIEPISKSGIDGIDFYHDKQDKITISKSDYEFFDVPNPEREDLDVTTNVTYLQIINVAFEHGKWKFSNGDTQFFADIDDSEFIKSVQKNFQQFGSTDLLKVELQTQQYISKEGNLKSKYTVKKVLEHKKGAQQINLKFTDDEDE
jgi:hypothetical protein